MPVTLSRDGERFTVAERLPVLPLRDVVVLPYVTTPLLVGRPLSVAALEAAGGDGGGDRLVLLVAQRNGEVEDPAAADLHRVGCVARLLHVARLSSGTTKVLVEGLARARVTRYAPAGRHLRAVISPEPLAADGDAAARAALARRSLALFEE